MAFGKIIVLLSLLALFLPSAGACFVSSQLELNVEDAPPVPPTDSVTINADVTFRWGFGSFLPLPVTIYFDTDDVPEWLSVSPSLYSFTITPKGFSGGEERKTISIKLTAKKETAAFSYDSFNIHAYTNGSFLVKGSEAEEKVTVMQDFEDKGIAPQLSDNMINVVKGGSEKVYLNITNLCNGDIYVKINTLNLSSAWKVTAAQTDFVVPSKYAGGNTKSIPLIFRADGVSSEEGWIEVIYSPSANPDWGEKTASIPVFVKSTEKGISGGAIAFVIILILIIVVVIALVWKKYRKA
ncbi:MAG: hypothetical protein U9O96_02175 [Candidatus Thermoplasmatota archaeon]|nr:hypothetical protein [Candidatus Thermoplasmatota archaeon]